MRIRSCGPRRDVALDAAVACFFVLLDTLVTLAGASWWPAHPGPLAWAMLALQAAVGASLVARRRAPMLPIACLTGFTLVISLLVSPAGVLTPSHVGNVWAPYGTVLAAYGPFYYGKDRRTAFGAVGVMTLVAGRVWDPSAAVITIAVLRTAVGPLLALYFRTRAEMLQALRDRAERAERERYLLVERARAEERARLAGEMHDVVTHRVSLMVLHAGALGITANDDATRQAAEELRAAGVQALEELRDLVGVLRTGPADDPTLASPVVGRTVHRIVREALTNVRKHAPGAHVVVQVSYDESRVTVSVRNTAAVAPSDASLAATGSGLGLASLRQRIDVVHGTLRAGGTPDGGFCLEATMPSYVPTAGAAV
jgi:signal transduction histidine kinase